MNESADQKLRVLLLTTARSYRNAAFLDAASRIGIEIVQGIDLPKELAQSAPQTLGIDFSAADEALETVQTYHEEQPLQAILPVDDSGSVLAAMISGELGLRHNSPVAALAARDKLKMRELLRSSGVNSPRFREFTTGTDLSNIVTAIGFPCVVKPRKLNGSRGVIRADDLDQLEKAVRRTAALTRHVEGLGADHPVSLIIESYIPGIEVALEAILDGGQLEVLALFDKPDPLEGPFFEETIYVTPSRLPMETQSQITACTAEAAAAIGLETGPVHAELRLNQSGPWIVEIAGRSIGGLCSQVLQFGTAGTLEEIILRQACGLDYGHLQPNDGARGVMMIPIPGTGLLRGVGGIERAEAVEFVNGVTITVPLNNPITPLPEGDGYLGFIFARGSTPEMVEAALRRAHTELDFAIDPLLPVFQGLNSPSAGQY